MRVAKQKKTETLCKEKRQDLFGSQLTAMPIFNKFIFNVVMIRIMTLIII